MIKAGIIGSTGYAGGELVRILTGHKEAEIKWYGSRSYIDQNYADVYRNLFQIVDAKCMDDNMDALPPSSQPTKSNWNRPTRPQLMPPMIMRMRQIL